MARFAWLVVWSVFVVWWSVANAAGQVDGGRLATRWDRDVSPDHPWPEYPRPSMVRAEWLSLNGPWATSVTDGGAAEPGAFDGTIRVPFPYEAALSGAARASIPTRRLWYRRSFDVPAVWVGRRVLLHFGAVNYEAEVQVNGTVLGRHVGGYDAFTFDVTDALRPGGNVLVVAVRNPLTHDTVDPQLLGKQRPNPGGVLYTACTGVWQTVWIEPVVAVHVDAIHVVPDVDGGLVRVTADVGGRTDVPVQVTAGEGGPPVAGVSGSAVTVPVPSAHLWTPDDPHLYPLRVTVTGGDAVDGYFAMRKVSLGTDERGRVRILLNGRFVFEVGALDQGYWPDGVYTAPTDAALRSDIDAAKRLGFNLLRKHAKVEPDRWYAWADRLGVLVWQDVPQAFGDRFTDAGRRQWLAEMRREIDGLSNHPSIVMWTLFNEGWGQHDTAEIAAEAKRLDPTRLINAGSGGYNQSVDGRMSRYRLPTPAGVGDVNDTHTYPDPSTERADPTRALVCGEFGGVSLRVAGHVWTRGNFGYGRVVRDGYHLTDRYRQLMREAYGLRDAGASAVVYTQLADVEEETNGLLTYDRAVTKPLADLVAAANHGQFPPMPPPPADADLVPTSADAPQTWSYTTTQPGDDWAKPEFAAIGWQSGSAPFGHGYPVGTDWRAADIWLRRTVTLPAAVPAELVVRVMHDEDVEVFVNGVRAAHADGYVGDYVSLPMSAAARAAVRAGGPNVIAVHCHNATGGQVVDVGIAAGG